jgi:hypothetical protein
MGTRGRENSNSNFNGLGRGSGSAPRYNDPYNNGCNDHHNDHHNDPSILLRSFRPMLRNSTLYFLCFPGLTSYCATRVIAWKTLCSVAKYFSSWLTLRGCLGRYSLLYSNILFELRWTCLPHSLPPFQDNIRLR